MNDIPVSGRARRQAEYRVYGVAAARAVFARRMSDVVKVYLSPTLTGTFASELKQLASRKVAYKLVSEDDLSKLAETPHHGGICLLVRRRPRQQLAELLAGLGRRKRACLMLLEDVGNPHNVGAILRSAAHFGVDAVLVSDGAVVESGAASRTAAGGAESVAVVEYGELSDALAELAEAGFALCATSSHGGESLFASELPSRVVFMFGEEQAGLSEAAFALSSRRLMIPGSGAVESLNVSVAAALLLAEYWRQQAMVPTRSGPWASGEAKPASRKPAGPGARPLLKRNPAR